MTKQNKNYIDIIASKMELENITQTQLAKKVGVSQRAISTYVCKTSEPSIFTLIKICKVLKIDLNNLFSFDENKESLQDLIMSDNEEIKLIKMFRTLSVSDKKKFLDLTKSISKFFEE